MRSAWGLETPVNEDVDWRQFAACSPETAEWFWFIGRIDRTVLVRENVKAVQLCGGCPVRVECEAYELEHPSPFPHIAAGKVWIGKTSMVVGHGR